MNDFTSVALINARGGSKGVARKNIRSFNGVSLVERSINVALASASITHVFVSTDDLEISAAAVEAGAIVPFLRPIELAQDDSMQLDVIKHAIRSMIYSVIIPDIVVLLQPTAPFRTSQDIDAAIELFSDPARETVISVCGVGDKHPVTMYTKSNQGYLTPLYSGFSRGVQRQDLEEIYWRNGAIYAFSPKTPLAIDSLYADKIIPYVMPQARSFNIDTELDWQIAEAHMKRIEL